MSRGTDQSQYIKTRGPLIQCVRQLSQALRSRPYDPLIWASRGTTLLELGIVELALGDLYKAQLLFEDALELSIDAASSTSNAHRGSEVRSMVKRRLARQAQLGDVDDSEEFLDEATLLLHIRQVKEDAVEPLIVAQCKPNVSRRRRNWHTKLLLSALMGLVRLDLWCSQRLQQFWVQTGERRLRTLEKTLHLSLLSRDVC
jgi:tetratricopeptide (TPR) repeat protein